MNELVSIVILLFALWGFINFVAMFMKEHHWCKIGMHRWNPPGECESCGYQDPLFREE